MAVINIIIYRPNDDIRQGKVYTHYNTKPLLTISDIKTNYQKHGEFTVSVLPEKDTIATVNSFCEINKFKIGDIIHILQLDNYYAMDHPIQKIDI